MAKMRHLSLLQYGMFGAAILGLLLLWPGLLRNFFATQGYDPHGQCYLWETPLVSLYVASDSVIGLSYVAIASTLAYFAYKVRRDIPFNWVFLAFGAFIIACGGTHFMDVLTVWIPVYWSSGYVRLVTAVASVSTAVALPPILPRIFTFIEAARLSETHQRELETNNQQLEKEMAQRHDAERALRESYTELEHRVRDQTAELTLANETLQAEPGGREQSNESLKRSEGRFRTLVETMPGAIVVVDGNGRIVLTNERVETLFGYTREELADQPIETLLPERFHPDHVAHRDRYLANPSPRPMGVGRDLAGRRKDGSEFPVEVGLSYTQTEDGLLALAFVTDITERKRAEVAVRRGEERFRGLIETAPGAILLVDAAGRIVLVNARVETLFGYPRDELIGQPIEMLLPKPLHDVHVTHRNGYFASPDARPMGKGRDLAGRRKDGTEFAVEIGLSYTVTDDRTLALAFVTDITERKRAEATLRRSEERFRTLVETAPGAILIVDTDGHITLVNGRVEALFGYMRDELIGQPIEILLPEPLRQGHVTHRDGYFAHPSARPMGKGRDLAGRRKDGSGFPVEIGLSYALTEDGMLTLAFVTDITERKQAQEANLQLLVREQAARAQAEGVQRRLTFLLEASTLVAQSTEYMFRLEQLARLTVPRIADWCAIEVLDDDGTLHRAAVAHVDPAKVQLAFELQRRYPPDSNAGQGAYQVLRTGHSELYPEIPDTLWIASARDAEHLDLIRQVGIKSALVVPLLAHERALGVITLVMAESDRRFGPDDLTLVEDLARRTALLIENARLYEETQRLNTNLEQRVVERTAQLEAANKELEAFSYSVSHDLRAPLRAIDGFSRMLLRDHEPDLPSEAQRRLLVVRDNAQKMGRLIDDLLAFSRLGRQPLRLERVSMNELVQQVLDDLGGDLENRQVKVTIADLPPCQADRALLKQVFVNLLTNAVKFTRQREVALIEVGSQQTDGLLAYFVKDNGAGFDMAYYDKLFGVFQRLHSVDEFEGTGVGLATVQRIVHRHGGRVWAAGAVDQGATFYFTLEGDEAPHG